MVAILKVSANFFVMISDKDFVFFVWANEAIVLAVGLLGAARKRIRDDAFILQASQSEPRLLVNVLRENIVVKISDLKTTPKHLPLFQKVRTERSRACN